MHRSLWKFEVCLAVAGLAACGIFQVISLTFVNPDFKGINWLWVAAIEASMLIAGLPAWVIARKASWSKLALWTNVFNVLLLTLIPVSFATMGGDAFEVAVAGYFVVAWAISSILPIGAACALFAHQSGE